MNEHEFLKKVSSLRSLVMITSPFIGSLLLKCDIRVTDSIDTAAVDKGKTMYINPQWFSSLSVKDQVTVLSHEALHLAFRHTSRMEKIARDSSEQYLYNVAADAVVNEILLLHGYQLPMYSITMDELSRYLGRTKEEIRKLSVEPIYKLLLDKMKDKKLSVGFHEDLKPELGGGENGGHGKDSESGMDEYWRDALYKAYTATRQAGSLPVGVERFFDFLRPKVNWRTLLREVLSSGFGSKVVSTYIRPSRKHEDLPGLRRFSMNNIWILADMSASIKDEEVSQFATEVLGVARNFNVTVRVVSWDVKPQHTTIIRSVGDMKKLRLKGGGGTMIGSTLEKTLKEMRDFDAVVILTDGWINDIHENNVQSLLKKISFKASSAVFVTTENKPELPNRWVMVELS